MGMESCDRCDSPTQEPPIIPPRGIQCRLRHAVIPRVPTLKKFSFSLSTEQYNFDEKAAFQGPYAHLRKGLDYNYHSRYRKERQWLQDSIIDDILASHLPEDLSQCITPTEPWLIFTIGVRGAGKKHVIRELVNQGKFPLLGFVRVDPDEIRRRLPEFDSYSHHNPASVDELTRKESGCIAEIIMLAALQAGRNVIFDGSMIHPQWHIDMVANLRKTYTRLQFGIFYITAPLPRVVERAKKGSEETGRDITQECVNAKVQRVEKAVAIAKTYFDFFCHIHNGDETPELTGMDWESFTGRFLQTCAWKPGMPGKQKMVRQVSIEESKDCQAFCMERVRRPPRRFSVLVSSEDNNRSDDMCFYGKYSHIRQSLDYTYHANYTFERQKLQDAIITNMLDSVVIVDLDGRIGSVPTEPWIVFTAGAMGAGKSHTMNVLLENGWFPLGAFVSVDPDEIRRLLPEYHMYINDNPELAGELTRKEAGFIAEILTLAALHAGKNVLQDGSLRDAEWYQKYFARLRSEFPAVRQAILHITAPREAVFERATMRAKKTGRVVPRALLEAALEQVPRSIQTLAPLVDYYAEISNGDDVQLVKPDGSNWLEFRDVWNQRVAYESSLRKQRKMSNHQNATKEPTSLDQAIEISCNQVPVPVLEELKSYQL
eukprot:Nitzschia sp. Nitz4//scaffold3_size479765//382355//384413//NITZ4_000162-RA/size479765-augustus-gene-1.622-mRNA-1//-1//CDS//3329550944//8883//frame0